MYCILVGIIQGCPSNGLIFATASHPFFFLMEREVAKINANIRYGARILCCADDAGWAFASFRMLAVFKEFFDLAKSLAGLSLKGPKCIIIPLAFESFATTAKRIKEWLAEELPGWSDFQVVSSSRYLGFWLGTDCSDDSWRWPAGKFSSRVAAIAGCGLSASWCALAYNTYALPVLLYVSQFAWPPAWVLALELPSIARVLHTPNHCLGANGHMLLDQAGMRPFRGMLPSCLSALFRCAVASLPDSEDLWLSL